MTINVYKKTYQRDHWAEFLAQEAFLKGDLPFLEKCLEDLFKRKAASLTVITKNGSRELIINWPKLK